MLWMGKIIASFLLMLFFALNSIVFNPTTSFALSIIPLILLIPVSFSLLRPRTALFIAMIVWGAIFFQASFAGRDVVATIPQKGSYSNDELMYLKTFHLYRETGDYYRALFQATIEGASRRHLTKDVWTWRFPTITYLWALVARDGIGIQYLFIAFALLCIPSTYIILRQHLQSTPALLGSLLLMPYLKDGLEYQTSFLFHEWWGLFFFLYGLACLSLKKRGATVIFLTLSVLIRELLLFPIVLFSLTSLVQKRNRGVFLIPITSFIVGFLIHRHMVLAFPDALPYLGKTGEKFHFFDKLLFLRMISFSMRQYIFTPFAVNKIFLLSSSAALFIGLIKKQYWRFTPLLIFLFFGLTLAHIGVLWNDYWGVLFMPIIIIYSVSLLSPVSTSTHQS